MRAALALIARDMALALRLGGGGAVAVAFFALVALLVPLGVGGEDEVLAPIAAGILWIGALLAALLSLDRLFQADYEDGSLDLMTLAPIPLEGVVAAKTAAHWLTTGLPMVVVSPVLAGMLQLPAEAIPTLTLGLLIGTPALSLIGAIGAALTVGVRRGGLLLSLLVLPLYIPTLVFGAQAVQRLMEDLPVWPSLALLGGVTLGSAAAAPFAAAAALRINAR